MSLDHNPQAAPGAAAPVRLLAGVRIAALVSSYHGEIGRRMSSSAGAVLEAAGLEPDALLVIDAPGAFELPLLAQALASRPDIDAVLAFGLVLRGATAHNEFVARGAAEGLARVALDSGKPVLFGVLTCDDLGQAEERADPMRLDKGGEVARAAIAALAALDRIHVLPSLGSFEERCRSHAPYHAARMPRTTWKSP